MIKLQERIKWLLRSDSTVETIPWNDKGYVNWLGRCAVPED